MNHHTQQLKLRSASSIFLFFFNFFLIIFLNFFNAGQFWNVPINIQTYSYNGPTPTYLDRDNLYAITVSHPNSIPRRFTAEYNSRKWDLSRETCFYAGNIQGGGLLEIASDPSFNDPVIEGNYLDYCTRGLFHNIYKFSYFSGCDL